MGFKLTVLAIILKGIICGVRLNFFLFLNSKFQRDSVQI